MFFIIYKDTELDPEEFVAKNFEQKKTKLHFTIDNLINDPHFIILSKRIWVRKLREMGFTQEEYEEDIQTHWCDCSYLCSLASVMGEQQGMQDAAVQGNIAQVVQ